MIMKNQIIEVSPTLFLNSLPTEKHAEVSALFNDENVDHIVLMIAKEGGERQVIAVGQKSPYKEIAMVSTDLIDGMQAQAFVDARKAFPDLSKKHSPRKHSPSTQTTKLKGLTDPHTQTSSSQSNPLQKQVDELKRKAEEELINRLTYLMEKEAELEQFEENLSHRERCLDEREGK